MKMAETAAAEGIPTEELADRNTDVFQRLQETLDISYDRFIRTSDADHYEASKAIWKRMDEAGDIYLDKYKGWYSVRDEPTSPRPRPSSATTASAIATETGAPVTWTEEQTLLLPALGLCRTSCSAHTRQQPGVHRAPSVRRNEVVSFVSGGLRGPVHLAHHIRLGRAGARQSRPRHVRLGGRADQLPHRRRLPGHDGRVVQAVLAGRRAHDRQGHLPVPRRVLAGVPDVRRAGAAQARDDPRLPAQQRRQDEQVARATWWPRRTGLHQYGAGPGALLPAARGAVRRGRHLQPRRRWWAG